MGRHGAGGATLAPLAAIPAGRFLMGSDLHQPEEAPAHPVYVDAFSIEIHPVTNEQFSAFVEATGYRTVAERPLDPADFPGAPPQNLVAGSLVFTPTPGPVDLRHISQWWTWTPGASWRHPEGPGSDTSARGRHPVVHVAFEDASAYAAWAGREIPTEAEWERAARGGVDGRAFWWGDEPRPGGRRLAKYWEGRFPWKNDASDGYDRTAPVGTYPPNDFGLLDMTGNVWEWTTDWYVGSHAPGEEKACCVPDNPRGPEMEDSYDPAQPQFRIPRRVIKGGSFLCADEYCQRYRPAARRPQMVDTGMSHIGFRCIVRGDDRASVTGRV
ncbi:MAG: formylglycine-generating enzyme family protein [Chloroflexota bacterium]|jgi:sulfatase modifying factor 1|nr:formylglycine-generating enzyme family protein [Chloroflexota bacterium]MDH5243302.1 formylglycine-generating enzyme family protein [Chloroflexota bacterium]